MARLTSSLALLVLTACPGKNAQDCADGFGRDAQGRCVLETEVDDSGTVPGTDPEDTGSDPDTGVFDGPFDVGPVVECESPASEVRYTEVGIEWGLVAPATWMGEHAENGSIAVADFDLDGDRDVIIGYDRQAPVLLTRDEDGFVASDLPVEDGNSQLGMADLDNDGRLDLIFAGVAETVLLNRETGWETESFPPAQWEDETGLGHIKSVQLMDIDRDGIQDAYALVSAPDVSGVAGMDYIAWGVGDGTFIADNTVVPQEWGYQKGFDLQWFDWDGDGWQDVYVVNELALEQTKSEVRPEGNFFLWNDGGTLGLANDQCLCSVYHDGMGAGLGDFNQDGRPDLFLTATGRNSLLQQLDDGTYVDVGLSTGADTLDGTIRSIGWGGIFVDFDNDGLLDIAIAEGDRWDEGTADPWVEDKSFHVVRQVEPSRFVLANEYGFGQLGSWRTIVASDHNNDGVLDFIVSDVQHRPMLLMSESCTANTWLEVGAPHGSRIEVSAGDQTWTGWANTASSFGGAVEPVVHFGLGSVDAVDKVTVEKPDGIIVEYDGPLATRRRIDLRL